SLWTLKARADRLLRTLPGPDPRKARTLARLREDPARAMAGLSADPWQSRFLRSPPPRTLALCSRQSGKSTAAAALALWTALCRPARRTFFLPPPRPRPGGLSGKKLPRLSRRRGRPVPPRRQTQTELELANGSRVVSLPENEEGIRGFSSVGLL